MGCACTKAVVSMQVQERHTGKLMDETVPSYLRSIYRMMYQNPVGRKLIKLPVTTSLLRRATARHGVKMDDPQSVAQIEKFIETYGVDVQEVELSMDSYLTFNDFFCRRLKAGVRSVASPHDDTVLVSPADCRLLVFPSVEDTAKIWLKGQDFTVSSLLGPNFQHLLDHFHSPAVAIARLAPQDYHRWHMPLAATVGPRDSIAGTYFSVSPRAVREVNILCTNKREVCMFDSPLYGKWCMIAVGAAMVSSIVVTDEMREGRQAAKGDEHGLFRYGGSTIIMLFDSRAVTWDADLIAASRQPIETYVKVGTRIGRSRQAVRDEKLPLAVRVPSATAASSSPSPVMAPSPTSPSLILTATTDAARKEANLNDEGLMHDFPYTMQSDLTLLPRESGDTVLARGVPATTRAKEYAAEAAGGRRSGLTDILPSFLSGSQNDAAAASGAPSTPVPAPPVFHLVQFTVDADADPDGARDDEEDDEDAHMNESASLLADTTDGTYDASPSGVRSLTHSSHLAPPSATSQSRRRDRSASKSSSEQPPRAINADADEDEPKRKKKKDTQ